MPPSPLIEALDQDRDHKISSREILAPPEVLNTDRKKTHLKVMANAMTTTPIILLIPETSKIPRVSSLRFWVL